jgi:O-antigen/teichoic acid export membrane protein
MNLRSILRHTLVYGSGTVLSRAVGFLLIPLYTRYLVPDDYGALSILDLLISIVTIFIGTGLGSAASRFYYAYKEEHDRAEVIATAAFATLGSTILAAAVLGLFAGPLARLTLGAAARTSWIYLAIASYVFNVNVELGLSFVRTEQRSGLFTAVSIARLLLQVALNVYLIVVAKLGVAGYLWSSVLSGIALTAYVLGYTVRRTGIVFSWPKLRELALFSFPLVPATLGLFVQNFANRFFLEHAAGLAAVGIYSLASKFGMLVGELIVQPFFRIWGVSRFEAVEAEGDEAARRLTTRVYTYYVLALAAFWVGMSAGIDAVVRILATPEYRAAARYVPWITLGYVLRGITYYYEGGAYIRKRPGVIALSNTYFAVVNMALNVLLIPRWGADGATAATVLTFAGQTWYMARRNAELFPFPEERSRLAKIVAAALGCVAIGRAVAFEALGFEVAWAIGTALLFPAFLTMGGFWSEEERGAAARTMRRLLGGPARRVTASS